MKVQKTKNSFQTFFPSLQSSLQKLTDLGNTGQVFRPNLEEKTLKMMRVKFKPTMEQKNILNLWFGVHRWSYNKAKMYSDEHKVFNFRKLRDALRTNSKYSVPYKWNTELIPPRIITGGIKDYAEAHKTSMALLETKRIKSFVIKKKLKKDRSQTLNLEKSCFSTINNVLFPKLTLPSGKKGLKLNGFYKVKKTKLSIENIPIKHDCRISYINSNFFLLIPIEKEELIKLTKKTDTKLSENHSIISINSGVRTFQTGYCPEGHTIEVGENITEKMKKSYIKLDTLNKLYFNTKRNGSFTKKFRHMRSSISGKRKRIFEKIRNKIDDLHWKTVKFLTENYQYIIISDFKVKQLLQLKKLARISKRCLSTLSHYKFRQRLIERCKERGNYLFIFDESYTSKTCGRCGKINQFSALIRPFLVILVDMFLIETSMLVEIFY